MGRMAELADEYGMEEQDVQDGFHMAELHHALCCLKGCISEDLFNQVEKELGFTPAPKQEYRPLRLDDGEPAPF